MITETVITEVTQVSRNHKYLNGYSQPAVEVTSVTIGGQRDSNEGLRAVNVTIPGNLPIGTRFKVIIEQIDEVTPATINRGALPTVIDNTTLLGSGD